MNTNSNFDIYAVDVEYYKHESFEILIPRLYGVPDRKNTANVRGARSRFPSRGISAIVDWCEEQSDEGKIEYKLSGSKTVVRFTTETMNVLLPPEGVRDGIPGIGSSYSYNLEFTKGVVMMNLFLVAPHEGNEPEKNLRAKEQLLQSYPPSKGHETDVWPKIWKPFCSEEFDSESETFESDIAAQLNKWLLEIQAFEAELKESPEFKEYFV